MVLIFGAISDRNPTLLLPGILVNVIRWLKVRRWCLASLDFIAFIELVAANKTTSAVILTGSNTLAGQDPLRPGYDLIADKSIRLIIALKQTDYFPHPQSPPWFQSRLAGTFASINACSAGT